MTTEKPKRKSPSPDATNGWPQIIVKWKDNLRAKRVFAGARYPADIATRAGLKSEYRAAAILGGRAHPSPDEIKKLAAAYNRSVEDVEWALPVPEHVQAAIEAVKKKQGNQWLRISDAATRRAEDVPVYDPYDSAPQLAPPPAEPLLEFPEGVMEASSEMEPVDPPQELVLDLPNYDFPPTLVMRSALVSLDQLLTKVRDSMEASDAVCRSVSKMADAAKVGQDVRGIWRSEVVPRLETWKRNGGDHGA